MRYLEHLRVPGWWWPVGIALAAGSGLAVGTWLGPVVGWVVAALSAVTVAGLLFAWGSARVSVDDHSLGAVGASIEWAWVAGVTALDAEATSRLLGVDADPRAWLGTRPYIATAVRVDIDDPADPHPYWVVSTRCPDKVAAAVKPLLGGSRP